MQHVLLQKGLEQLRSSCLDDQCDLKIISAGYGLIDQDTPIVPYEMTFQGMKWNSFPMTCGPSSQGSADFPGAMSSTYMREFYLLYRDDERVQPMAQLDRRDCAVFRVSKSVFRGYPDYSALIQSRSGSCSLKYDSIASTMTSKEDLLCSLQV